VSATPSAHIAGQGRVTPSVAVTTYDPNTGKFISPDGFLQKHTNLVGGEGKSWQDLMPT
ncbi:MAG: mammalian cell entry protein, partial [Mycolicibacterium hassiacum]|nr:mammalian cell entry protein [Mycolicibacterium hassiacum]